MNKSLDYIIVGFGIAGMSFASQLLAANKTFIVINDSPSGATRASGGVLNPTVLKRFTAAWNTQEFTPYAAQFYKQLFEKLHLSSYKPIAIKRILHSVEEQNDWYVASQKLELQQYLSSQVEKNTSSSIQAPFGLGNVTQAASMNPAELIDGFAAYLKKREMYLDAPFEYENLKVEKAQVHYQDISAYQIVFCEGAGVVENPFFPLAISPQGAKVFVPNKGEYIYIKAPELKIDFIVKGSLMLIPQGNDIYKVGATYDRDALDVLTTQEARQKIVDKLKKILNCEYAIVDQVAGVRPTVKDRKPLLGSISSDSPLYFFNGLGTRGLTMAPLLSKQLLDFIEEKKTLPPVVDIKRFLS